MTSYFACAHRRSPPPAHVLAICLSRPRGARAQWTSGVVGPGVVSVTSATVRPSPTPKAISRSSPASSWSLQRLLLATTAVGEDEPRLGGGAPGHSADPHRTS